jgi:hypothetical protein
LGHVNVVSPKQVWFALTIWLCGLFGLC